MTTALIERPISTLGLTDLASSINREHGLAVAAARTAVEHARRCGESLYSTANYWWRKKLGN